MLDLQMQARVKDWHNKRMEAMVIDFAILGGLMHCVEDDRQYMIRTIICYFTFMQ